MQRMVPLRFFTLLKECSGQELVGVLDGYNDELAVLKQTVSQYTETNEQDKRNRLMPNREKPVVRRLFLSDTGLHLFHCTQPNYTLKGLPFNFNCVQYQ